MMGDYFSTSYEEVLDSLKNLDEDTINSLFDNYNIIEGEYVDKLKVLADVITEEDIASYSGKENTSAVGYIYDDVDDIAKFLATSVDDYVIEQLFNQYACNNLTDLAIALTDSEIENLGYLGKVESTSGEKYDYLDELGYYDDSEYDEDLDYLEDVNDLDYYLIDKDYSDEFGSLFACDSEEDFEHFKESLDSVLIDNIQVQEELDGKIYFTVKPHNFEESKISEEVIINNSLNPLIFDEEHKMLPEVKEQIETYVNDFINKMKEKEILINAVDLHLIGSNAGYLYTPTSDIDVHIISGNKIEDEQAQQLFDEFDIYEAENPLMIGEHQVELGIEDSYDIALDNKDARIYSFTDNDWVDNSDSFEEYKQEDISKVEGYEEIVSEYTDKIDNAVDNDEYNKAVALKAELRQNRSDDLANIGTLSMGNVVFKELRNNGSYNKLKEYISSKEIQMLDE